MGLINERHLKEVWCEHCSILKDCRADKTGAYKRNCWVMRLFSSEATVEAIPIEWIEEWGWKNGMSESMSLRVMIDDWEKGGVIQ